MLVMRPHFALRMLFPFLLCVTVSGEASLTADVDYETTGVLALGIRKTEATVDVVATLHSHKDALEKLISAHAECNGVQIIRVEAATFARVAAVRDDEHAGELFLIDFRAKDFSLAHMDERGLRDSITQTFDEANCKLSVGDISVELSEPSPDGDEYNGQILFQLIIVMVPITAMLAVCRRRIVMINKTTVDAPTVDVEVGLGKQDASSSQSDARSSSQRDFHVPPETESQLNLPPKSAADPADADACIDVVKQDHCAFCASMPDASCADVPSEPSELGTTDDGLDETIMSECDVDTNPCTSGEAEGDEGDDITSGQWAASAVADEEA